jgi:hypothetical protein
MLGAKPEADHAGRNSAQKGALAEEPYSQRRRELPGFLEYPANHPVLDKDLELLRRTGRELPTTLNRAQVVMTWGPLAKTRGQDVGGGDGVLDREIYAHPTYR